MNMQVGKMLLADDDAEDKEVIQEAMESLDAGDITWFAKDGSHALKLLSEKFDSGQMPSLIVLDLNMPKLTGTETLSQLKKDDRFKNIPVIIYSTSINPLEKEKCLSLGAHSYITKPVSFKESIETAEIFLRFCRTSNAS